MISLVATTFAFLQRRRANERANAFYERAGFPLDGAAKTEDAWAHLPEVRYRRSL